MQFDTLARQVAATNTVHGSAQALIAGIAAQLTAAIATQPNDNGSGLRALATSLTQQAQSLAAAVSANTPAGVVIPVAPPNPPNTPLTPTSYGYDPAVPMVPVTPVHGTTSPEPYGRPNIPPYGTPGAPNQPTTGDGYTDSAGRENYASRTNKDEPYATTTRDPGREPQYSANTPPNPNEPYSSVGRDRNAVGANTDTGAGRNLEGRNADAAPLGGTIGSAYPGTNRDDIRDPNGTPNVANTPNASTLATRETSASAGPPFRA
jgi:hypothetical protein